MRIWRVIYEVFVDMLSIVLWRDEDVDIVLFLAYPVCSIDKPGQYRNRITELKRGIDMI